MSGTSPSFDSPLPPWIAKSPPAAAAAALYGAIVAVRNRRYDKSPAVTSVGRPVISIGGIRAGGSGKTPAVILVAGLLQRLGYEVAVLSRGYKRVGNRPLQLAPAEPIDWLRVGDEPAMIRSTCPGVWLGIGPDRSQNAKLLAQRMGSRSIFLLDDGFQHRAIYRNLDIVCIHESILFDRLLPQGFLREPIEALSRADLFFYITSEQRLERIREVGEHLQKRFPAIEKFILIQKKECWVNLQSGIRTDSPPFKTPVAFCGIARPERFFETLAALGVTPCRRMIFPDHHRYTEHDFYPLRELYSKGLITTEKDAVRLKELNNVQSENIWYLKMGLYFLENETLLRFQNYIRNIDQ